MDATYNDFENDLFARRTSSNVLIDITGMSSQKQNELAQQRMAQGRAEAFRGQVYFGGRPATVVVYR